MIFGRRVDRSRLLHQITIYGFTWLYRLILVIDSLYRTVAIHRRTLRYRRFRRGRWGKWLPSIWHALQRADAFIVAQGIPAEKKGAFLSGSQRGLALLGQVTFACALVFLFWISWPRPAAAPDQSSHPPLIDPAFAAPADDGSASVLERAESAWTTPAAPSPVEGDASVEDASALAGVSHSFARPSVRSVLSQVLANSENDGASASAPSTTADAVAATGRQAKGFVRSVAKVLPLLDELAAIQAERNRLAARVATARAVAANVTSSGADDEAADGSASQNAAVDGELDAATEQFEETMTAEETLPADSILAQVVQAIAAPSTDAAATEEGAGEGRNESSDETAATPSTDVLSPVTISAPVPAPAISYPYALELGRPWVSFVPAPSTEADHYWLDLPFPPGYNQIYSPNYQFGSTAGGRYRPHHGVDTSNPVGTPVLAMAEGEVVHAGPDDPILLGPYNNFYGNSVVVRLDRRLTTPEGEQEVYLLYGHLNEVFATAGQQIAVGDPVGTVGMTGIAIGPHLHVEVRVGQNSYFNTVNPALWIRPVAGTGSVAVRVVNAEGRSWTGAKVSLLRYEGGGAVWSRTIETYRDTENLVGDPLWGENGALSNIRAGSYYITTEINGEKIGQNIEVRAGETTFVELRTMQ